MTAEAIKVPFAAENCTSSLASRSSSPNDCRCASSTKTSLQAQLSSESLVTKVLPIQTVSRNEAHRPSISSKTKAASYLQWRPHSKPT